MGASHSNSAAVAKTVSPPATTGATDGVIPGATAGTNAGCPANQTAFHWIIDTECNQNCVFDAFKSMGFNKGGIEGTCASAGFTQPGGKFVFGNIPMQQWTKPVA